MKKNIRKQPISAKECENVRGGFAAGIIGLVGAIAGAATTATGVAVAARK
ncbi:hypothetical protein ID80_004698 [Salmonella enterica subsp. enterica serovar Ball]|nr:hypothetical protein [Salmonella enterica subsp. enterica serovar Ball]EGO7252346.1 hypothetical protein [Salmonella enterica]EJC3639600.1 hypothetical protein [Salmonella enterica]